MAASVHEALPAGALDALPEGLPDPAATSPGELLKTLVEQGADRLPLPGHGRTQQRWRSLARIAAIDLSLAKLYEGHTDALAILAELDPAATLPWPRPAQRWGVWCAHPPGQTLIARRSGPQHASAERIQLSGEKQWCSGASSLTHALVSCEDDGGQRCLVALSIHQPGVRFDASAWQAVGMQTSDTWTMHCQSAQGVLVGAPGSYLSRPGFQHGGGGVAACWYGALTYIVETVRDALSRQPADPHRLAHLGAMDVSLSQAAALLRAAAAAIDAAPSDPCTLPIQRARLAVEAAAEDVLLRTPRSLGAGPLCSDAKLARMLADLPVFIRQSHAERDQARHGTAVLQESVSWSL